MIKVVHTLKEFSGMQIDGKSKKKDSLEGIGSGGTYSMTQYAFDVKISRSSDAIFHCKIEQKGLGAMEGEIYEDTLRNLKVNYRILTGTIAEQSIASVLGGDSMIMVLLPTNDLLVNGLVCKRKD